MTPALSALTQRLILGVQDRTKSESVIATLARALVDKNDATVMWVDATGAIVFASGVAAQLLALLNPELSGAGVHGANISSATTTNLETATGQLTDVTGTTTITALTLSEGHLRVVRFTGILTLTNGASLVLPGGANITTAAGDFAIFAGYASSVVRCVLYQKASGKATVPSTLAEIETAAAVTPAADNTYASPTSITIKNGIITAIS